MFASACLSPACPVCALGFACDFQSPVQRFKLQKHKHMTLVVSYIMRLRSASRNKSTYSSRPLCRPLQGEVGLLSSVPVSLSVHRGLQCVAAAAVCASCSACKRVTLTQRDNTTADSLRVCLACLSPACAVCVLVLAQTVDSGNTRTRLGMWVLRSIVCVAPYRH